MFLFKDIIGNEHIVSGLKFSAKQKKLFHSYIFYGENGIGKFLIANCFAKFIQCENNKDDKKNNFDDSCDICYSCKSFDSKNNPDIIYVYPSKLKNIGVDDIREQVYMQINSKPYICSHKIFIIDNADQMTTQAQNALLKILEEPPEYVIFILLGERLDNFLLTIISRCVKINIKPVADNLVSDYLIKKINIDKDLAKYLSIYSHGNIGKALKLADDKNFINIRENILNLLQKLDNYNYAEALTLASEFEKFKDDFALVLDIIYTRYYNLINLIDLDDKQKKIFNKNQVLSLYKKIKVIDKAKKYLSYNTNFKMILNTILLEICGG